MNYNKILKEEKTRILEMHSRKGYKSYNLINENDTGNWEDRITKGVWNLQMGSEGYEDKPGYEGVTEFIKQVQKQLGLNETGVFDKGMKDKVIEFQRENGLTDDGIVGKNTYGKLPKPGDNQESDSPDEKKMDTTCLDKFTDSKIKSKVKGGINKEIGSANYTFFTNGRYVILNTDTKGNWKCDAGRLLVGGWSELK